MTLVQILVNLLIAILAFFLVRYLGSMVAPEGQDIAKIVTIIAIIVAIIVFFSNVAARIVG